VQAIRREGKFISSPDGNADVRVGDHLLLCGGSYPLNQLQQWLTSMPLPSVVSIPLIKAPVSEALQEFLPLDSQRNSD